ncbi:hypothetical protein NDU88_002907 [Pleurodeles waltl]|uniref:Uncharacterized protein n=1 Tax=Pleurodeles waltl TaxID=8319 RepID=A0AAV7SF94_PLEWA|nr:hypothetical protein NDU88_002907 [Pleurodeles waltl]
MSPLVRHVRVLVRNEDWNPNTWNGIINGGAARATQGASPKALGCLPERNPLGTGPGPRPGASLAGGADHGRRGARERGPGAGAGSSGQEDPTLSRGRERGAEGGRARASPAPDPPGAARWKSEAPPETEPTPTRHDPGRENRIEVPPWAGTTPERPAVHGQQGSLDEEEPGPAREPRLHPTRAGGWASPSLLARLGAARLEPGDSRPAGVETPAGGWPACRRGRDPPLIGRYPGPSRAEGFEDSRSSSRSSGRDRRRRGCPGPSRSGYTPRQLGGEAPGPSAWKRSWNRGG